MRQSFKFVIYLVLFTPILLFSEANISQENLIKKQKLILKGKEQKSFNFNVSNPDGYTVLWIKGRFNIERGEGWGDYGLQVSINKKSISEKKLINKKLILINSAYIGQRPTNLFSEDKDAWFLRFDSDYSPYNSEVNGDPYNRISSFSNANTSWNKYEFENAYYVYAFNISDYIIKGINEISFRNINEIYSIEMSFTLEKFSEPLLFFTHVSDRIIFPCSFPREEECNVKIEKVCTPGEIIPITLSLRNESEENIIFDIITTPLESPDNKFIPKENIEVFVLTFSPTKSTIYEFINPTGEILHPDILNPSNKWEVKAKSSSSLWLRIKIPQDISSTDWTGKVILKSGDKEIYIPIKVKILPFELSQVDTIFGLWDNKLPGAFDNLTSKRIEDLKNHGINSITTDPWTSPITIKKNQDEILVDTSRLKKTLQVYKTEGLNTTGPFPYGTLEPVFNQIKTISGQEIETPEYQNVVDIVLKEIMSLADELGMKLYFHPTDEPDVHPDCIENYEKLLKCIKKANGKIWSNNTVAGFRKWYQLIDINCVVGGIEDALKEENYTNFFFPQWGSVEPEWVKANINKMHIQTQVRSTMPYEIRKKYGIYLYYTGCKGIWGFAYNWGTSNWYIAWPFLNDEGKMYSTIGWEMLREGITDYKYLKTLEDILSKKIGEKKAREKVISLLPPFTSILTISNEYFSIIREKIINEILKEKEK
ncbi:MAG TPA: hypothetical protein PLW95_02460 [bacterium]|nr:hypothetical protein [bacterium]